MSVGDTVRRVTTKLNPATTPGAPELELFEAVADASPTRKPWKFTGNCLTLRFDGGLAESLEYAHFPDGHKLNVCRSNADGEEIVDRLPDEIEAKVIDHGHGYARLEAPADGLVAAKFTQTVATALGHENGLDDVARHKRRSV